MKFTGYFVAAYALLILLGGLVGYLKADSIASLASGTLFGAVLFTLGLGITRNSKIGFNGALILTGLLTAIFAERWYFTQKMMPAGMMLVLSGVVFLFLLAKLFRKN